MDVLIPLGKFKRSIKRRRERGGAGKAVCACLQFGKGVKRLLKCKFIVLCPSLPCLCSSHSTQWEFGRSIEFAHLNNNSYFVFSFCSYSIAPMMCYRACFLVDRIQFAHLRKQRLYRFMFTDQSYISPCKRKFYLFQRDLLDATMFRDWSLPSFLQWLAVTFVVKN